MMLSESALGEILDILLSTGAEFAEVYAERRQFSRLVWEDGHLDEASSGTDAGIGLRMVRGGTTYCANGNEVDVAAVRAMAATLAGALSGSSSGARAAFERSRAEPPAPVRVPPRTVPVPARLELLRRADAAARGLDRRVAQVSVTIVDTERSILVANSEGALESDATCYLALGAQVVAKDGETIRSGYSVKAETAGFELFERESPESIAREAGRVAILQLGARPAPAGTFTVVLSSRAGGTLVHEACGHVFEGDFIEKGLSVYTGKLGQKVASELVTVYDDGTLPNKRGTNRVDDEGVPTSRVLLIEDGVLRGYLLDRRTAKALGMPPTGNGRRESFRHLPIPRMRNTCLAPGRTDPEEIVRGVSRGILVAGIGGGEVDIVTGDFVFHCSEAYLIENGAVGEPIRDATLTGNGPEILRSIDAVGSDLGFNVGTCGKDGQGVPVADAMPTIRIPAIVVGDGMSEPRPMTDEQVLDCAMAAFRDRRVEGELYLERSASTRIAVHEGEVESLVERRGRGAGMRVFLDGRTAFAFTSELSREAIERTIQAAREIACEVRADPANELPAISSDFAPLVNVDPGTDSTPLTEKIQIARRVEAAGKAAAPEEGGGPRISKTRESSYQDARETILIANTMGESLTHEWSRCYAAIELVASDGSGSETGAHAGWALGPGGLDPAAVGREAARRALAKLGARQPPTRRTAVLLDPEAAAALLAALAPLFSAEAVIKKRSLLADRLGQAVASPRTSLIDDGAMRGACLSAPVDGEGTACRESALIEGGTLRALLHTALTARKLGVAPTGNGVRGSYSNAPEASPTNLYLRPTGISREALLASVRDGIYVTELMGLHTVDTVTGDFSLGARGHAMASGEIGPPLARMAVSGNVLELLGSVQDVATDLRFQVSGVGSTILLGETSVSGAGS